MELMSGLPTALATVQPREKSGARTGSRYAFQAHVSLAKLLDLHTAGTDFRAVFDYFDDLTILSDASPSPASAEFFQIKGKQSGAWTAVQLARAEGNAPQTIVGKMYYHTVGFGSAVASCGFVTNAPFDFTLSSGEKTTPDHMTIAFGSLGTDDQRRLKAALDLDFKPPRLPDEAIILKFERTLVPLSAYDRFLKGCLVEVLGDNCSVAVNGLYRLLIEEITKRANDATTCANMNDVFARKSLCRRDLQDAISAAETRRSVLDHWDIVDEELKDAGRSTRERIGLHTAAITYVQERAKRGPATSEFASAARSAARAHKAALEGTTSMIAAAASLAAVTSLPPGSPCAGEAREAAFLVETFEALHG
jgi:hypothetical protein